MDSEHFLTCCAVQSALQKSETNDGTECKSIEAPLTRKPRLSPA